MPERGGKVTAKTPERVVVLGLSQKAAKVLDEAIAFAIDEWPASTDFKILEAIRAELKEQIATPKKKKGQKRGD